MKVESYFLLFISVFGAFTALLYWFLSYETSGTTMLAAVCLLGFLPGTYYLWWSRRMGRRAEDDPNAKREDGAGVVGAFPSTSIWPFVLGMGLFLVALALVFGTWSAVLGIVVVLFAIFGVIAESRHGGLPPGARGTSHYPPAEGLSHHPTAIDPSQRQWLEGTEQSSQPSQPRED